MLLARVEASAEEDPVAEFGGETLRRRDELELSKDSVDLARIFKDEGMQLRDRIFYEES